MLPQVSYAVVIDIVSAWIVQTTVVVFVAMILLRVLRKRSAHLHYAILLVALSKFAVPPVLKAPISGLHHVASGRLHGLAAVKLADPFVASPSLPVDWVDRTTAQNDAASSATSPSVNSASPVHEAISNADRMQAPLLSRIPWTGIAAAVYFFGSFIVAWRLLCRTRQLKTLVRSSTPLTECHLSGTPSPLAVPTSIRRRPRLLVSPQASTPFAAGLFQPVIVLPAWVLEELPVAEQRAIVLHELKHHQRLDVWVAWLQNLLTIGWWFHPAWWLLNRRVRVVREESCDESVLRDERVNAHEYAQSLVSAARCMARRDAKNFPLVPGIFSSSRGDLALSTRVKRILAPSKTRSKVRRWIPAAAACVLAIVALPGVAPSSDQETSDIDAVCHTGIVVDTEGRPVAGAKIVTYPRVPGDQSVTAESNSQGVFVIRGVKPIAPGRQDLDLHGAVFKPGLALGAFSSAFQPSRVIMDKPDRIRVAVETPDGDRLPGANLTIGEMSFRDVAFSGEPPDPMRQELSLTTGEDGFVTFRSVQRASLRSIVVETERWGIQRLSVPRFEPDSSQATDEPMVVRLKRVGRIDGTVIAETGDPMCDYPIMLLSPLDRNQGAKVTTDQHGRFHATLPVGRYRLAAATNHSGQSFPPITVHVRAEETTEVSVACQATGTVIGRVVTDQGKPAEGASLVFSRTGARIIVASDEHGYFRIELGPGQWDYECFVDEMVGYVPPIGNQPRFVDVLPGQSTTVDNWVVTSGEVIPGRIEGIDTSQTRIRCVIAHQSDRQYYWAVYDADGRFQLTIPRGMSIRDIERFEVRFVDQPIEVVSHEPLVLKPVQPDNSD